MAWLSQKENVTYALQRSGNGVSIAPVIYAELVELSDGLSVKSDMRQNPVGSPRWTRVSISIGVGLFILALALSAVIVPQLRLLHLFQALIYVAVIVLTRRNSPWGFGVGVIIPTAWNCLNLFVTHLFQKGQYSFGPLCARAVLVSSAHGPCEPTGNDDGDGWRLGPFSTHHRLYGRVHSAAASYEAMGPVPWRRHSGFGLLRSNYRHCGTLNAGGTATV
jgi:hypothetical protein